MKQAFHIFLKDVRRLWPQIAGLMLAIGYFAILDIRFSPLAPYGSGNLIIEFIVGAAAWFLIARTVHQESLPGEDQFWLTRPYARGSLLASKVMMAVGVIGVPLFLADCVIVGVQSLGVSEHLGGLILRQVVIGAWLILPPFAIASITRSITEDIMVWLAGIAIAGLTYFPYSIGAANRLQWASKQYMMTAGLALLLAVIWRQYMRRGTLGSRIVFAAAVLLPALPSPVSLALGFEPANNRASGVSLAARVDHIEEQTPAGIHQLDIHCAPLDVEVRGVQPGWRIAALLQKDTFESGGKTWSTGWRPPGGNGGGLYFDLLEKVGIVSACATSAGLSELGSGKPLAVHVSVVLEVIAENAPIRVPASFEAFDVAGLGTCQFRKYSRSENYALQCGSPVWMPPSGKVRFTTPNSPETFIASGNLSTPWNLLPGLSPVAKWVTLSWNSQIRDAVAESAQLEFTVDKRIGVLVREVTVPEVRFLPVR